MSFDLIRESIEARMVANWFESEPVEYENVPLGRETSNGFVRLVIINGDSGTHGMGGNTLQARDTGMVSLQVFVPKGSGTKRSRELCDAFAAIFEHKRFNGITTYTASVAPSGMTGDKWLQVNVTVPFRRVRDV